MGTVTNATAHFSQATVYNLQNNSSEADAENIYNATSAIQNLNASLIALQENPEIGICEFFEELDNIYVEQEQIQNFKHLMQYFASYDHEDMLQQCPEIHNFIEICKDFITSYNALPQETQEALLRIYNDSDQHIINGLENAAYPGNPEHRQDVMWLDFKIN